jgi:ABC-2 type transport system ATP-binding protein
VHAIHLGAGEEGELSLSVEQEEGALPGILRLLEEAGFSVERLVLQRPSLDEVFLRYSGRSLREAAASEAFIDPPTQPVWKGK